MEHFQWSWKAKLAILIQELWPILLVWLSTRTKVFYFSLKCFSIINLGSIYLFIQIYFLDKLKEQFPEVDFGVIPGINDPEDPQSRTNFAVFMSSLIIGMIWITYITFFNSRAVGRIVTSIANRFVKSGYIKVSTIL